jgi:nitronate monooxygenase
LTIGLLLAGWSEAKKKLAKLLKRLTTMHCRRFTTRACRIPKSLTPAKGLQLPMVAAPMFLASNPALVTACCKAGIVGTFPALNQRSTQGYEDWLNEIKQKNAENEKQAPGTVAPFGVNLIVHKSNPRLEDDLKVTVKHKVPLVITSLGAVKDLVDSVHSYGGVVFHDIINVRHARKVSTCNKF